MFNNSLNNFDHHQTRLSTAEQVVKQIKPFSEQACDMSEMFSSFDQGLSYGQTIV